MASLMGRLKMPGLAVASWLGVAGAAHAAETGSEWISLVGNVEHSRTLRMADLQAEPATTLMVFFSTGSGPVSASFTGVLLWTLLQEAGIKTDPAVHNDILRHTIELTATDGYQVVLGAGEIAPNFGGEQAIIAYAQNGAPLPAGDGFARLIMPGDKAGGRNLFALSRIEVK